MRRSLAIMTALLCGAYLLLLVPPGVVHQFMEPVIGVYRAEESGPETSAQTLSTGHPSPLKRDQVLDRTAARLIQIFRDHRRELFAPLGNDDFAGKNAIPTSELQEIRTELAAQLREHRSSSTEQLLRAGIRFCDLLLKLQEMRLQRADELATSSVAERSSAHWPASYLRTGRKLLDAHEALFRLAKAGRKSD